MRHSGTTLYRSPYEPASPAIAGEGFFEAGYDPLTYAVEACHQLGLAVHAWMVTYPLVSPKRSPHPLLREHADWAIAHKGSYHLDPGNPEVRSYVAHLATDLARRYAIDGVHFDYFRYPEAAETFNDRTSYARYGSSFPSKAAWRRDNLTRQLREVRDSLTSIGSDIQVSVAPLGKLKMIPDLGRSHGWTAYESVYQDPETWGREGLVDFVVPMMYYRGDLYSPFLQDWKEKVAPYIPVIPGLAAYRVEESGWPSSVIAEQIAEEREVGLSGICFFREQHTSSRFPLVRQVIKRVLMIGTMPFALLFIVSPWLFPLLFGGQWVESGDFARALTPWLFILLVTSPLSNLFVVTENQDWMLIFSVVYAAVPLAWLWLSPYSLLTTTYVLGAIMCVILVGQILMADAAARGFDSRPPASEANEGHYEAAGEPEPSASVPATDSHDEEQ